MSNLKKLFYIVFICIFFLCSQKSYAGTASNVVDKGINGTAKATYYVTKYTLKGGWFVIKKTAKGVKMVSKSIFSGTKDAFKPASKITPVNNTTPVNKIVPVNKTTEPVYTLPPAPKIN